MAMKIGYINVVNLEMNPQRRDSSERRVDLSKMREGKCAVYCIV